MGVKDDLIKAKVESFKIQGTSEDDIDTSAGSAIEVEAELINIPYSNLHNTKKY